MTDQDGVTLYAELRRKFGPERAAEILESALRTSLVDVVNQQRLAKASQAGLKFRAWMIRRGWIKGPLVRF